MGNRFVITGLRGEATYGTRDDDIREIRQTGTGRRPDETELAIEQVETKTPKSDESHNGAANAGLAANGTEVRE